MADLIKELGLEKFTEEEKNQVMVQLADSLLRRLLLRVYEKLNKEDQAEFNQLAESGSATEINKFLEDKVPGLSQIRDEEWDGLIREMKDFLKIGKQAR